MQKSTAKFIEETHQACYNIYHRLAHLMWLFTFWQGKRTTSEELDKEQYARKILEVHGSNKGVDLLFRFICGGLL